MNIIIPIIAMLIVAIAYILKDTLTEKLSNGKSFINNENKGFR
jgi:Flp pilus assembly pilin Flp